jgi:16S rRNA (cytidine1402-2'-O)-methyltransferase
MTLYLLPNLLDKEQEHTCFLPKSVDATMQMLDGLIAEDEKEGRRYLKRFQLKKPLQEFPIRELSEHTSEQEIPSLLDPSRKGEVWGLVSDAGLPCIADPGSKLVAYAHTLNIPVRACVGPSSIFMALMLSGFTGEKFCFHGYLSKQSHERIQEIKRLEQDAKTKHRTHIFMEAPYRNDALFHDLLTCLEPSTHLCVAVDLTAPSEQVISKTVQKWRSTQAPSLNKRPTIFLMTFF